MVVSGRADAILADRHSIPLLRRRILTAKTVNDRGWGGVSLRSRYKTTRQREEAMTVDEVKK